MSHHIFDIYMPSRGQSDKQQLSKKSSNFVFNKCHILADDYNQSDFFSLPVIFDPVLKSHESLRNHNKTAEQHINGSVQESRNSSGDTSLLH